ncbi:MAG TPA: hypothetical protein VMD92_10875 [Acidobacteriaceae bacterium]|jgi:hypothetical protein|nr:hypothetical protein [Acidobacteriaceae bacterium]
MNSYLFLRRMRGPIFLLTFGVTAILDVYTNIDYSRSWPLYLIVWGVLKLAENAILAQNPPPPPGTPGYPPYPGQYPGAYSGQYPSYGQPGYGPGAPAGPGTTGTGMQGGSSSGTTTAIVPSPGEEGR